MQVSIYLLAILFYFISSNSGLTESPGIEGIAAAQCEGDAAPVIERFGLSLQLYEQGAGVPFAIARSFCVGLVPS